MTTFWDTAPSDVELELWWTVEAEGVKLPTAAKRLDMEPERAAEAVERVEAFLQAAKRIADTQREETRRRPLESCDAGIDFALCQAAWSVLFSLRERLTVHVQETGGRVEKITLALTPQRPAKSWLKTLKYCLRLQRDQGHGLTVGAQVFRRTSTAGPAETDEPRSANPAPQLQIKLLNDG